MGLQRFFINTSPRNKIMKELCLVDGDIVCYRCAATANGLPKDIALVRTDELMRRILHETNATNYKVFLSGANNFRYTIFPEYKAHRKDKPRPEHLEATKEFLVTEWKATITDGYEADDELAIEQVAAGTSSIIASIDKDLLQIPGYHYDFVKGIERFVSPFDALRCFYKQLITGDGSDGIPAFDGKIRGSVPKFVQRLLDPIDSMTDELDMYKYVCSVYEDSFGNPFGWDFLEQIIHRNARCLYLLRREGDKWHPPGQKEDDELSLPTL